MIASNCHYPRVTLSPDSTVQFRFLIARSLALFTSFGILPRAHFQQKKNTSEWRSCFVRERTIKFYARISGSVRREPQPMFTRKIGLVCPASYFSSHFQFPLCKRTIGQPSALRPSSAFLHLHFPPRLCKPLRCLEVKAALLTPDVRHDYKHPLMRQQNMRGIAILRKLCALTLDSRQFPTAHKIPPKSALAIWQRKLKDP